MTRKGGQQRERPAVIAIIDRSPVRRPSRGAA